MSRDGIGQEIVYRGTEEDPYSVARVRVTS